MIIKVETDLEHFEAWSGAVDTLNHIIKNDACEKLENILEEVYPEGLTDTQLNDLLWFEPEWCFEMCGISNPYEDE